jgi:SAM-dependent methyltransferase
VSGRATSFGAVAAAYERFRPGYPTELVDLVTAYAKGPVRTALEIGAGTGKATRVFAVRGILVTATEPDAAMLDVLRQHIPANVVTVTAALEDLPSSTTYDLVYAAAALHWTDVDGRWRRIADLLRPGGTFASFGGPMELADATVAAAVHEARRPFLDTDEVPSPDGTPPEEPMQWPGTELERSPQFTDVQQHVIERRTTLSSRGYVGHLSTVSAYLQLPADQRRLAFERILDVLPDRVEITADITVHLARRHA